MAGRHCYRDVLPVTGMLTLQCAIVGSETLFKAASNNGLSYFVFAVYYHGLATLLLLFIIFNRRELSRLNMSILKKIFLCGAIGAIYQLLGFKGIGYSSPTLSSTIANLLPAFTFTFAIIFRMETVNLRSSSSWAKIFGTLVSISGAILVILYKGPPVILTKLPSTLSYNPLGALESNLVTGGLHLTAQWILVSIVLIVQAQVLEEYPSKLVVVFFTNLFDTLVSRFIGLVAETNADAWRISSDVAWVAILYSRMVVAIFTHAGSAWLNQLKGPVFVASFLPVSIIIAVAMGVIILW